MVYISVLYYNKSLYIIYISTVAFKKSNTSSWVPLSNIFRYSVCINLRAKEEIIFICISDELFSGTAINITYLTFSPVFSFLITGLSNRPKQIDGVNSFRVLSGGQL